MSSEEEDDDPVVSEVDVFLSRQLSDRKLLLLQYPVRPGYVPYDTAHHLAVRARPNNYQLQMELAVDTKSPNYANSKGEQIALNVDGAPNSNDDSSKCFYSSDKMDKQMLTSSAVGGSMDRYVIGTFRDKELHLTPVNGVLQMRPSFSYLDLADTKVKEQAVTAAAEADSSQDEEEQAKPVMVKFARQETDDAKARRMASYDFLKKRQEEEKWIDVDFHPSQEYEAEHERCLLFAQRSSDTSEFYMTQDQYLQRLVPREQESEEEKPAMPNNVLSMVDLKKMSLTDQIKALLTSAKVIRFSQLLSLLPKGHDATAVLRIIQQVATLVQGCWVVKSEFLYPKDSCSAHSGVPAETLCKGRDYIMWRFTQSRYLVRKDIASVIKLPAEDVKDILEQMAHLKVNKGWEFLMEYDYEFVNRHLEVYQRQQMLWERKFQQLSLVLNLTKADLKMAVNAASAAAASLSPRRRRTSSRSRTKSGGEVSMSDLSDMDVDGPAKDSIQRHSSSSDRQRQRRPSGNAQQRTISFSENSTGGATKIENGISDINITATAMDTNDSSDNPTCKDPALLQAELCKFAADRLTTRFVLSTSEFKRLFLLKLAESAPGHIFGSGVSDRQLEQSLVNTGARHIQPSPNSESFYAIEQVGDDSDPLRAVIVNMLQEKIQVRLSSLRKRLESEKLEMPTDNDIRKLLKDYCVSKGSVWHLKGHQPDTNNS